VGSLNSQFVLVSCWNGFRSLAEVPGPKIAAARTSAGDYQKSDLARRSWTIGPVEQPPSTWGIGFGARVEKAVE